ncbi:sensor histidine kinase [Mycolicibacterium obuense]|uniref:histidine kinase n=1 Tax=Mycolicibacterium obuense TaxID=1807 RepID=A0A0M2JYN9_9MYCO|nr:histidine kinase [Mycolicibacterium obuense]KKE99736.1 histidine kinase [Mycolicibacterium obuense]
MLDALRHRVRGYAARKADEMPGGYTWPFVISVDVTMVVVSVIAALQRPWSHWWIATVALLIGILPDVVFFFTDRRVPVAVEAATVWLAWTVSTALFLFAFPTPISGDFAPLLLSLLTGMIGAFTSARTSLLVALSAAALVGAAVWAGRLETPWLYLTFIAIGLLVGWLMRIQQELLLEQRRAHAKLAEHAAADERRRIAREVHDVIAHSLSVTLLHVTGARRDLQVDRDVDEAVDALEQAERLGRQAMADIRHTVGLLDDATATAVPNPGIDDLASLVEDFVRAGLSVSLRISGDTGRISAAEGLALYRIAQESLANVAKHAPEAATSVTLDVAGAAVLTIVNRVPVLVAGRGEQHEGRGMRGMRQRIELLGGTLDAGPDGDAWSVRAVIPVEGRPGCVLRGGAP